MERTDLVSVVGGMNGTSFGTTCLWKRAVWRLDLFTLMCSAVDSGQWLAYDSVLRHSHAASSRYVGWNGVSLGNQLQQTIGPTVLVNVLVRNVPDPGSRSPWINQSTSSTFEKCWDPVESSGNATATKTAISSLGGWWHHPAVEAYLELAFDRSDHGMRATLEVNDYQWLSQATYF